jgi:hypothetical protein
MVTNLKTKKQQHYFYADDKEALDNQLPVFTWKDGKQIQVAKVLPERAHEAKKRTIATWEAKQIKKALRQAKSDIRNGKQTTISGFFGK